MTEETIPFASWTDEMVNAWQSERTRLLNTAPTVPTIYDVSIEAFRPVTQDDVDRLVKASLAWSVIRAEVRAQELRISYKAPTSSNLEHG